MAHEIEYNLNAKPQEDAEPPEELKKYFTLNGDQREAQDVNSLRIGGDDSNLEFPMDDDDFMSMYQPKV